MLRLNISSKFALVGLAFVIPIAILLSLLAAASNVNIDFSIKEINGNVYLRALRRIHEPLLQEKVLYQRNKVAGERNALDTTQAAIDEGIRSLEAAEKSQGPAKGFTESAKLIADFKKSWDAVKGELAGMPLAQGMKVLESLNNDYRNLYTHIGDKSNLILDPDLDTYYMMDAELLNVPRLADNLNKLQLLVEQLMAKHQASEAEKIQVAVLANLVSGDLAAIRVDYDTAYRETLNFNKNTELKDKIDPGLVASTQAIQAYLSFIDANVLKAARPSGSMSQSASLGSNAHQKWFAMFDTLNPNDDATMQIRVDKLQAQRNFNFIWSIAVTLLVALVGAFVVLGIIRNIRRLNEAAQKVTAGDLSTEVHLTSQDELGNLSESFNTMVGSIRQTTQEVESAANASEEERSRLQGIVEEITNEISNIKSSAEIVTDNARIVAETATEASGISSEGETAVQESIQGVERIKEQIESVAGKILELSGQTQAIGNIISTVDDIAKQSKFLAFNASIEASKVGEQGKGFAIVANEIKNLSEESKEATKKIGEILSEIQGLTNTSVMLAEDATKLADSGYQLSSTAGETINKLTFSIQNSAEAAIQITSSALEQQSSLEQLVYTLQKTLAAR